MPALRRARDGVPGDQAGTDAPDGASAHSGTGPESGAAGRGRGLRALSPAGLAILIATVIALALRLFLVTRPGFLTSGTVEYDDGVYLGAAMRLLHGAMPYKDYAFVQPPGIVVVALPAAFVGSLTSQATGLALARVLSVLASTACVPLAGRLVRHRGPITVAVTAGLLAVYPADVLSARTLLLEPWMNLACLLAVSAAFRSGRLASPRWLALAGVALGFGVAIKFWAAVPAAVLLAVCLISRPEAGASRARRAGALAGGAVAGFAVLAGPFALAAPSRFIHQTLLDQVSRQGSSAPTSLRLAHLTGLIDVLGRGGTFALPGSTSHSLFSMGAEASTHTVSVGWPAYAAALIGVAVIAAGYLRGVRQRTPLEWFALVTAVLAAAAILRYPAFFYHYPDFPAPWLAIAVGVAVGSLACLIQGSAPRARTARRVVAAVVAVVIIAIGGAEARELSTAQAPASPAAAAALIPTGSCLVADQVSFAIAANRFPAPSPGCPDVIDSLAETLALSGGISPQGGAGRVAGVVPGWEHIFGLARYVWLQGGSGTRIPWTAALQTWFNGHFRLLASFPSYGASKLYVRDH
ncbi:MAG TPA: phospholipid carrier-dependent glycosyltransferase [Trebonia sp.]